MLPLKASATLNSIVCHPVLSFQAKGIMLCVLLETTFLIKHIIYHFLVIKYL